MKNKGRYRYGLLYTIKGTEIYTFSNKSLHACPCSVLVIPKDEIYRTGLSDEESIVITIDFETTQKTITFSTAEISVDYIIYVE